MPHWTDGPESILAPTSIDAFMEAHWDGVPLIVQNRGADLYRDLLSIDALDALIHGSGWQVPTFRLVKEGNQIPHEHYTVDGIPWGTGSVSGFMEREHIRQFMRDGATFVM